MTLTLTTTIRKSCLRDTHNYNQHLQMTLTLTTTIRKSCLRDTHNYNPLLQMTLTLTTTKALRICLSEAPQTLQYLGKPAPAMH